jgi:hypothetical protein
MIGSKLHKGSVIYDATTGTEQGAILHDGTYTSTDTPASTDTLLIKQSGVQKQITYADLTDGLGGGGGLTSVKDWTGILTTTNGTSVPVTEDLNGVLIAVEFWTANTADYPRVLQYGRMDTNGNLKFLFTNINTFSSTATLYLNIFGLEYTSSSALEMILPTATYMSTSTGSPSTPSATTTQDTIYLVDIYKVTEA